MTQKPLSIGQLASIAEVNVETIRYYQRIGIITEPLKPNQGYRIYPRVTVDRIRFIKRAQQLGFTLQEINDLLELSEDSCDDVRTRAEAKRAHVEAQIRDLSALRSTLNELITACKTGSETSKCPIVETLAGTPYKAE